METVDKLEGHERPRVDALEIVRDRTLGIDVRLVERVENRQ